MLAAQDSTRQALHSVLCRYVRSRADNQMAGHGSDASSCEPERYVNGSANSALTNNGVIDPCGLIAWSFFNDTYTLADASGNSVPVDVSLQNSPLPPE